MSTITAGISHGFAGTCSTGSSAPVTARAAARISLTETDAELGAEVRRLLFVFEDIVKLDDRAIQLVLREADQKDLALALRGVSDDVRDRIMANMSERGAQMLLEEMEYQPPQRKRVVEEAQGRVVAIVRKLEESGAVVLSRGEADDVL